MCCIGVRYKSYCANICRTLMVDPSEKKQNNYEFLIELQDEVINKLTHGNYIGMHFIIKFCV